MSESDVSPAVERVGEVCEQCGWTLTVEEVQRRERDKYHGRAGPDRVRQKLGSLGEGHAYFNRGHRVRRVISDAELERYVGD